MPVRKERGTCGVSSVSSPSDSCPLGFRFPAPFALSSVSSSSPSPSSSSSSDDDDGCWLASRAHEFLRWDADLGGPKSEDLSKAVWSSAPLKDLLALAALAAEEDQLHLDEAFLFLRCSEISACDRSAVQGLTFFSGRRELGSAEEEEEEDGAEQRDDPGDEKSREEPSPLRLRSERSRWQNCWKIGVVEWMSAGRLGKWESKVGW